MVRYADFTERKGRMALLKKEIQKHLDAAYAVAVKEYERMAREIMRKHPNLVEFMNGMGRVFFVDKNGDMIHTNDRSYLSPIDDFLCEWDEQLHLTGDPMRFTADGPVVRDW